MNIIVQAGGRGSRLEHHTANKPKCLVSINGKPLLYNLGDIFKGAKFYIIGDYKIDVLDNYLRTFPPPFDYTLIKAQGKGTCAGLQTAIDSIKDGGPFGIVWSDLYFGKKFKLPLKDNFVGITNELICRFCIKRGKIVNERSDKKGVVGFFLFNSPELLPKVPNEGEFVRFLEENRPPMKELLINGALEVGTIDALDKIKVGEIHSRFFNSIKIKNNRVIKTVRDKDYKNLMENEINWYRFMEKHNYQNIPKIHGFRPLEMQRIIGFSPHNGSNLNLENKKEIINKIFMALDSMHGIGAVEYDKTVAKEVYVDKTLERINKIKPLVPNNWTETYIVNGKTVRNLFHKNNSNLINEAFNKLASQSKFFVIHGDPTFSNIIISKRSGKVYFIDPRGYFSSTKIYGDELYDYAKLYYSAIGNYDAFNERRFKISIDTADIKIHIESSGWEGTAPLFKEKFKENMNDIKILHALIWLSLSGYVIDDVDSMLGAYFHGLELLEEAFYGG